jgi:hypothetical protein
MDRRHRELHFQLGSLPRRAPLCLDNLGRSDNRCNFAATDSRRGSERKRPKLNESWDAGVSTPPPEVCSELPYLLCKN